MKVHVTVCVGSKPEVKQCATGQLASPVILSNFIGRQTSFVITEIIWISRGKTDHTLYMHLG